MAAVGTCTSMCPVKEAALRKRMKRLWYFETQQSNKDGSAVSGDGDLSLCVKEYSRPAAGTVRHPEELRTPAALEKTVDYLLSLLDVSTHRKSWVYTTNFISDRLRAVRQDIIIQQLSWRFSIPLLEKIVRYHILIKFVLHTEAIKHFDPTLNGQILRSYLGDLMEYYNLAVDDEKDMIGNSVLKNMGEFNSYHILLNLNDPYILLSRMKTNILTSNCNTINLSNKHHNSRTESLMSLALCYHNRNYYRFFKEAGDLTFLESCCLLYNYSDIRFLFLNILNTAFSSKTFYVPLEKLKKWLQFDTDPDTLTFLDKFGVESKDSKIYFNAKNKMTNVVETARDKQEFAKKFSYVELTEIKLGANTGINGMNARSIVENRI